MDEDVKICPQCEAEYYAHVAVCKGCEVPLVHPQELNRKTGVHKAEGELVCIIEGPYDVMKDLSAGLKSAGIECEILNAGDPNSCSGPNVFGVFVPQSIFSEAVSAMKEAYHKIYPELKGTEDRYREGLCPACGADVKDAWGACPDCGLNLLGGGPHGGGGGDCGPSCGS